VIVRSADRPELVLEESVVELIRARGDTIRGRTDSHGVTQFGTTDTAEYVIRVRHLGVAMYQGLYRPRPGCHERLEVYLGEIMHSEVGGSPAAKSRVMLTTCAPDAKPGVAADERSVGVWRLASRAATL
jgi:hypothetical protein